MTQSNKPDHFKRRLARADAIMSSQMNEQGIMRPFAQWPRNLRREFSRLAAKSMGQQQK